MHEILDDYKTQVLIYEDLQKQITKIIKKRSKNKIVNADFIFSIFESSDEEMVQNANENDWLVKAPIFKQLFTSGKCDFHAKYEGAYKSQIYENPTWEDIVWETNSCVKFNGQLDHVFLESVDLKSIDKNGIKHFEFWFGS